MSDTRCEHYWRDGVLMVERGQADPHRDDCLACRRAHEARGQLVRALALVGAGAGDPWWQERVWQAIRRERAGKPAAAWSWMPWASALAAACVLLAFVSARGLYHRERGEGELARPRIDIVPSEVATRSTSAGIGDRVRIAAAAHQEVRIYRGEKLLLRCTAAAAATTPGCAADAGGLTAEHVLRLPGEYQLLIVSAGILSPPMPPVEAGSVPAAEPPAASAASLDRDLQAITASGSTYQLEVLVVR
jgi:hypothetical protein